MCSHIAVRSKQATQVTYDGKVRKSLADALSGRTQLERGEAAAIAREVGCSREYVRQVMRRLGVTIKPPAVPPSCTGCGRPMPNAKTRTCQSCRRKNAFVTLKCAYCGKDFERRRSLHDAYVRRTATQRRGPVCSRGCTATEPRSCSWCGRSVGNRWRSRMGLQAFCGPPASCLIEAQSAIHPILWRYITEDLIPMKENLDGIARLRSTRATSKRRDTGGA